MLAILPLAGRCETHGLSLDGPTKRHLLFPKSANVQTLHSIGREVCRCRTGHRTFTCAANLRKTPICRAHFSYYGRAVIQGVQAVNLSAIASSRSFSTLATWTYQTVASANLNILTCPLASPLT